MLKCNSLNVITQSRLLQIILLFEKLHHLTRRTSCTRGLMTLSSCDHLSWTAPLSPSAPLFGNYLLDFQLLVSSLNSVFRYSNKNSLQSHALGEYWIRAEFHCHVPGGCTAKTNFSLNSFPEACEILDHAERLDFTLTHAMQCFSIISWLCSCSIVFTCCV